MINYYLLTKPGIIMGNLFTVAAGFLLGSHGHFDFFLFIATALGIGFIIASACVFNNYLDRPIDRKMDRTKHRVFVQRLVSENKALIFASLLVVLGTAILYAFTNIIVLNIACLGYFIYVIPYSFWKRYTVYGTAIGSIAGATPSVIGYCAASHQFDIAAAILFAMMVLWQMPHFFAIALYRLDDYTKAGIPVLPVSRGIFRTKIQMLLYILVFIPTTMLLTLLGYTGNLFLLMTGFIGLLWLALGVKGFTCENDKKWGHHMFLLSLVIITGICIMIPFDRV